VTMSACENLHRELIAAIADNIRDDNKSLSAFRLVCKAWTYPARDHLFASLTISDVDDRFKKIKAANITSTYTPFLRHLRLLDTYSDTFWHEVIPFLADFSTPRLQSLRLNCWRWHSLSPDERSAFLRRFDSIVSLELSLYCQYTPIDVATIICAFPHLQTFILLPSRYKLPGPSPLAPELRLPERLSTLCVRYSYQDYQLFLEWLASIPEQLSIRTFELSLYWVCTQDIVSINVFLKALGPSLEVFRCNSCGTFVCPTPTVGLI
jgi:hypothetical protein